MLDSKDPASDSPPLNCPCLLSCCKAHKKHSSVQDSSIVTQKSKYSDAICDSNTDNALVFWAKSHDRFPQLHIEGAVSPRLLCTSGEGFQ
ncbi:hypothetical protein GOODEAATRI_029387 [Goodea atripinnis]|uniref:Uncharacterized protein n=1 Tax=Goodea atripinnis TaxID=208336 RepID=A0ABV0MW78_9TELE